MIVVEDEHRRVAWIPRPADALIAGTEIAGRDVFGHRRRRDVGALALPRPVLPMRRDHHPLFTQRVPPLLPCRCRCGHRQPFRPSTPTGGMHEVTAASGTAPMIINGTGAVQSPETTGARSTTRARCR